AQGAQARRRARLTGQACTGWLNGYLDGDLRPWRAVPAEMTDTIRISVDAMGGDEGPRVAVHGALLEFRERKNARFIFHGRKDELGPLLDEFSELKAVSRIVHSDNVISMDEKPSQALRKGRGNSSMWAALESVRDGDADVVVSGGN